MPLRRNTEYLRWLLGDLLLDIGTGIGAFAFPLITFMVTDSLSTTGLVALVQGLGAVVGMIPGGLLADRVERRRLRLLAGLTGALVQLVLVVVLLGGWAGAVVLAALAFLDRMLKQIVPTTQLPRAVSVNQGREAAVEMASGPVGGALLGLAIVFPPLVHLLGNVGSFLATLSMRGRYRPRAEGSPPTRVVDDLREAIAWIRTQPIRLQMLAVSSAVNLGANGLIFTVLLDLADAGVPAARIGLLNTALAASILLGAFLAPRLVDSVPTGVLAIAPVGLMAVVGALLPLAPGMVWIAACYAVLGIGLPAINASGQGFVTHITPVAMQGRISALMRLVSLGVMTLAPALAGWGLELAGSGPTLLLFAGVLAVGTLVGVLGRDLRRLPVASQWERHARAEGLSVPEPGAQPPGA
jgi:MFS family permease